MVSDRTVEFQIGLYNARQEEAQRTAELATQQEAVADHVAPVALSGVDIQLQQ